MLHKELKDGKSTVNTTGLTFFDGYVSEDKQKQH